MSVRMTIQRVLYCDFYACTEHLYGTAGERVLVATAAEDGWTRVVSGSFYGNPTYSDYCPAHPNGDPG